MKTQIEKARALLALHQSGFILPNAWDAGSAIVLASEGFPAIASTSGGIAFSLGKQDYQVSDPGLCVGRAEMFDRLRQIVDAVSVPVSGDLEAGWGDAPGAVADTIVMAIEAGLAGGNIEDKTPMEHRLYDEGLAVERIAAAREAGDRHGGAFVLNARTDAFQMGSDDALKVAIRRANLFLSAGADCVYTPGAADLETIGILAREIDGPLNVVSGLGAARAPAPDLFAAGVRRITVGASIARSVMAFIRQCAIELREEGSVGYAKNQIPHADLNALFGEARAA